MNRRGIFGVCAIVALGFGLLHLPANEGLAQQKSLKDQLVGTWTFVSALDVHRDGTKTDRWGPNPKGILMFDGSGRFVQVIHRSDLPKFAASSQNAGTADEFNAVMQNLVLSFGTYSVDEAN